MNPARLLLAFALTLSASAARADQLADDFASRVQPLLGRLCLSCHSTEKKKGDLDLQRYSSLDLIRKDVKPWQAMIEMLESGDMPPKKNNQPTAAERKLLIDWVKRFLDGEARARAGDPGPRGFRRLSNAEYDRTIADLTGVDLRPARQFPADGAAGEGFTNATEALAMSPTLLNKYFAAAKEIADHAVLLPDGVRFSPAKTRRDWTNEAVAAIKKVYGPYCDGEGRYSVKPYLAALVRSRDGLLAGRVTVGDVAAKEKLNAKYLGILWHALTDNPGGKEPSFPLDRIRSLFANAAEKDIDALAGEIASWQASLWRYVKIGSYGAGAVTRQLPNDAAVAQSQTLRLTVKPQPGQNDVAIFLQGRDLLLKSSADMPAGEVIWQRPRFEKKGSTLLLKDYASFGPRYEVDYPSLFADTPRYLAAVVEAANNATLTTAELAKKHQIDESLLKRWIAVLAVEPLAKETRGPKLPGRLVEAATLTLLDAPTDRKNDQPWVNGWRPKGTDLPIVVSNASNDTLRVPGTMPPWSVAVHPTPKEFVAVAWKSPIAGSVRIASKIQHAHPACGNGVAWWLELRQEGKAYVLDEGALDLGKGVTPAPREVKVAKDDLLLLMVDARSNEHTCDLTEISLTISDTANAEKKWDLAGDIVSNIQDGNPHADRQGNKDTWRFVRGPSRPLGKSSSSSLLAAGSVLDQWRQAASDPKRQGDLAKLAEMATSLLTGSRPADAKSPDRALYDKLVAVDSPLFESLDVTALPNVRKRSKTYGPPADRFGGAAGDDASIAVPLNQVLEFALPAALLVDHEFVVDGKLASAADGKSAAIVKLELASLTPSTTATANGKPALIGSNDPAARAQFARGFNQFRDLFPTFLCFPNIVPTDEVVCLKQFHREDEPLLRLFLYDEQARHLNRLWDEHRFISQFPLTENEYLPLFIGFVTQDQPKELLVYYEGFREPFRKRAEEFSKEIEAAAAKQMAALFDFTARAWRRPLRDKERADLQALYDGFRAKGLSADEAFRGVLARVLVSPSFLYHLEQSPPGKRPQLVNDFELAARLSYFLWSSPPDAELRNLAAAGKLSEPGAKMMEMQTLRMLKDSRVRALAIEFGTQMIHVRGFDERKDKSETLFPTFNDALRAAMYEESILFFQDLFASDQPVTRLLDAEYTFLNETMARHYGIPGVAGPLWRRVEGVRKYGRGGILGLAAVQATQAGASRTSPVLRGNWVVETLLGEKLPRPPANVPQLPESETGNDGKTMRQLVELHVSNESCATCHQRIDPFGFALEHYDPIGRRRDKDLGGLPIDAKSKLRDGTEFEGIDGLRDYLLTKKKDVIVRLFCRRLLGYALGRSVMLSDQPLIDEMVAALAASDGRVSAAVLTIVRSPQFRMIRGSAYDAGH